MTKKAHSNRIESKKARRKTLYGHRRKEERKILCIYIYKREEAAPRTVAGWQAKGAAKLKFLRSSDDAATHKKFKRFILVGGPRRASLAFFPI